VFKGVSFEVDPGFKVGVCGRAGAGKSTVSLTMARVLEIEEGTIEIDGVDISKVGLRRLRNKVTFIPQEACLFKRHLKYNLDPTGKISEDELRRITASSGLEELLRKQDETIKDILEFKIEHDGNNLSAGEKQLVCIIRALLRKSKVVLLDEATANIDILTEQKIMNVLNAELKGSTVITIAHRLNTISASDRIAVIGKKKLPEPALDKDSKDKEKEQPPSCLLEYGNPKELVKIKGGHFAKLHDDLKKEQS